jgi:histone-binding protein RBBP4
MFHMCKSQTTYTNSFSNQESNCNMSSTADILNDHQNNPEVSDILEERLIDAEYKIWKKNSPYLYDFVMTHSLEWPSLTCQWLPHTKTLEKSIEHNLLLGTHTTGEQNYLMVASVNLAKDDDVVVETNDGNEEDQGQASNVPTITAANYEEEKGEVGGFGHASSSSIGKIEIRMKIKHDGEVNRARYMPQNHFIVASRGPNPEIYIWDLSKHSSFPDEASVPAPQGVCIGHKAEGYGMCWSNHQEGRFITCSDDKTVALWDVNSVINAKVSSASGTQIKPLSIFSGHTAVVEDVDWHRRDVNLIGSVGDDRAIRIWDVRKNNPNDSEHVIHKAHEADINSIAFNPINEFLLATGSSDKTVALWDMRNLKW